MKIYTVHIKTDSKEPLETAVFVREGGFSIMAAVFQVFWALYHRMWFCAALLFLAQACMVFLDKQSIISNDASFALRLGYFALVGFSANDWYRSGLSRKGYTLKEVITARDESEAQEKFFGFYATQTSS